MKRDVDCTGKCCPDNTYCMFFNGGDVIYSPKQERIKNGFGDVRCPHEWIPTTCEREL